MQLNNDSITARFYRWFYNTKNMPLSLCPYFWQLVWMWVILLPLTILTLPTFLMSRGEEDVTWISRIGVSIVMYCFLLFMVTMVLAIIDYFFTNFAEGTTLYELAQIGVFFWFWVVLFLFFLFLGYLSKKINKGKKTLKEDRPSIVLEFIKAKYNKICPRLDWIQKN